MDVLGGVAECDEVYMSVHVTARIQMRGGP